MPMSLLNLLTPWPIKIFLCLPHSILLETNCLLLIFSTLLIITNPVKSVFLLLRSTVSKLVFYKTLNLDPSAFFVTFNFSHVLFANKFVCDLTSVISVAFPLLSPDFFDNSSPLLLHHHSLSKWINQICPKQPFLILVSPMSTINSMHYLLFILVYFLLMRCIRTTIFFMAILAT